MDLRSSTQSCPGTMSELRCGPIPVLFEKGIARVPGLAVGPGPAGGRSGSYIAPGPTWTCSSSTVSAAIGEVKDAWRQALV